MINSLFMLGSSYNKDRRISAIFMGAWIVYMISANKFVFDNAFVIINAVSFLLICVGINLIKNKTANTILSIVSILIWSIVIDTICYFIYPGSQDIFTYIGQGIIFNYKYIFANILAVCGINAVIFGMNKIEERMKIHKTS